MSASAIGASEDVTEDVTKVIMSTSRLARWLSVAVVLAGAVALVSRAMGVDFGLSPDWATMKANSALGLLVAGVALGALTWQGAGRVSRWVPNIAGVFLLLLGAATLSQDLFGWNLRIDELVLRDLPLAPRTGAPGRMAPSVAIGFMLVGPALLLLNQRRLRSITVAQWLSLVVLVITLLALIGYAYGAPGFYQIPSSPRYTAMRLYTALSFALLGLGLLACHPQVGPVALLTQRSLGGRLARGLLPLGIGLPFVLGALHAWVDRTGIYSPTYVTALFAVIYILLFATLIASYARRMGHTDEARQHAQAAERVERERYRTTLASIGDGVIATDLDGRITYLNAVAEQLTGWLGDHALGQPADRVFQVVRSDSGDPAIHPVTRVRQIHETVELENNILLVARHGEKRPIEDSAAPIRGDDGAMIGVVLVFRDITERRRAEMTRRHLAAVVESSEDAIVSATTQGIVLSWNGGAERLYGYTAEEMIGQSVRPMVPPEQLAGWQAMTACIQRGESVPAMETTRVRKDGRRVEVALTISPVFDAKGRVVAASAIARDITARRRAEALQHRLASIVESSDDAIISKSLDGTLTSWNRGAEKIYGYTAAEAIGQSVEMLVPEDRRSEVTAILARIGQGQRVEHYETVRQRKDGRHIFVSLTVSPMKDEADRVIGASIIARDITEREQARRELERMNQKLEQRVAERTAEAETRAQQLHELARQLSTAEQRERERIARTLHDHLQQLLVAAKMALGMSRKEEGERGAVPAESINRTASLIDEAIQASRDLTVELFPPVLFESGLASALHWLSDHFKRLHQLPVYIEADADAEPDTAAVRAFLFQAVRELLLNVVKHSQCDEGAWVRLRQHNALARIEVEDHGVGCDPEKAFTMKASEGSLGLRDMRQRAQLLGGGFWMEAGKGCRVILEVPMRVAEEAHSSAA